MTGYKFIFCILFGIIVFFTSVNKTIAQLEAPELVSLYGGFCIQKLMFTQIENSDFYEIIISEDSNFNNIAVHEQEYIPTNHNSPFQQAWYYFPVVKFNTTYYVKARAINESDTSVWSNIKYVTTQAVPNTTFVFIEPEGYNLRAPSYNMCSEEATFWEIDTTPEFNSPALISHFSENLQFTFNSFYFCKDYYYRVKVLTSIDTSAWSAVYEFSTVCMPNTLSPQDIVLLNSEVLLFIERFIPDVTYQFQLDTSLLFPSPRVYEIPDTNLVDHVFATDLYFGSKHAWRVRALNSTDTAPWTPAVHFHMTNFYLATPVNGAVNINPLAYLHVFDIGNISGYIYEYDSVASFDSPFFTEQTSITSAIPVENLKFGRTYYWRARAYHSLDTSAYTETRQFSIIDQAELQSPVDAASDMSIKVNLSAKLKPGVSLYDYQLSECFEFQEETTVLLSHTEYYNQVITPHLKFNKDYYWRARYIHSSDTSNWSAVRSFTTVVAPELISPSNGSTEVPVALTMLNWQHISHLSAYRIWISTDQDFNDYQEIVQPHFGNILFLDYLNPNTTYYWKVQAISPADTSEWSSTWVFSTETIVSTENLGKDTSYYFYIYPNPSQHSFTVIVDELTKLNAADDLYVIILDANGRQIYHQPIVSIKTQISTLGWLRGVYICKLYHSGKHLKSKKFVLE